MDYKEIIKLWIGPKLMVFLADPRDIELILSSQVYLDKSPEYRFFKPWLGNGLLISSGKSRRNSISFSFPFLWPQQHIFCLFLNRLTRFKLILFSINNMRVEEEYLMKAISVNTGFLKEHLEPPCTTFRIFALQIQVKKHFREDDFDLMIKNFALECLWMIYCEKFQVNADQATIEHAQSTLYPLWTSSKANLKPPNEYLLISGHKWRSHRKLIAPTFHLNVLKSFIELFNDNSRHVCKKMRALNGKTFDCHDYMSECTVEILLGKWNVPKIIDKKKVGKYLRLTLKLHIKMHHKHQQLVSYLTDVHFTCLS